MWAALAQGHSDLSLICQCSASGLPPCCVKLKCESPFCAFQFSSSFCFPGLRPLPPVSCSVVKLRRRMASACPCRGGCGCGDVVVGVRLWWCWSCFLVCVGDTTVFVPYRLFDLLVIMLPICSSHYMSYHMSVVCCCSLCVLTLLVQSLSVHGPYGLRLCMVWMHGGGEWLCMHHIFPTKRAERRLPFYMSCLSLGLWPRRRLDLLIAICLFVFTEVLIMCFLLFHSPFAVWV